MLRVIFAVSWNQHWRKNWKRERKKKKKKKTKMKIVKIYKDVTIEL